MCFCVLQESPTVIFPSRSVAKVSRSIILVYDWREKFPSEWILNGILRHNQVHRIRPHERVDILICSYNLQTRTVNQVNFHFLAISFFPSRSELTNSIREVIKITESIIINTISEYLSSLIVFREHIIHIPHSLQPSFCSDIHQHLIFPSPTRPDKQNSLRPIIIRIKNLLLVRSWHKIIGNADIYDCHSFSSCLIVNKSFLYL